MKKELEDRLFKKYPKIFVQKDLDMTQTCMCWGVSVNDGWYDLLDVLCDQIQGQIDHSAKYDPKNGVTPIPQVEATQVKEKFGGLRFYYNGGNEYIAGMVSMAESMSNRICEECGKPGTTKGPGWFYTRCPGCRKELYKAKVKARPEQLSLSIKSEE